MGGYVDVFVTIPDGKRYRVEIDPDSSYGEILNGLVSGLNLPDSDNKGRPIHYRFSVTSRGGLEEGAEMEIEEIPSPSVGNIRLEEG